MPRQQSLTGSFRRSLVFLALALAPGLSHAAATITVVNKDGAGEGFNDSTPVAPVGGNTETTLGKQRLRAFQFAANIWGALIDSGVTIRVGASLDPLECDADSAILGSAGPETAHRNFAGAEFAGTWYGQALANRLAGNDLAPLSDDIGAQFNSNLDEGDSNCLHAIPWYYGLDGNPPGSAIDFVTVVLHELGHGLNFLTFVDETTGAEFLNFPDVYEQFMEDHPTSTLFPAMTDTQRQAAGKSPGNLHFVGENLIDAASGLSDGRHPISGHVELYAPNPPQPGSSLSHFSNDLAPNELMEPFFTRPIHDPGLAVALLQDLGWPVADNVPCHGIPATIVGTEGNDRLVGTRHADVIVGLGGDDTIIARGRDDLVCGGDGNDLIRGGPGHDTLDGGPGDDILIGGSGSDTLDGGSGVDTLKGGLGSDTCSNGESNKSC